eukprot:CAMPEP_0115359806 /NCGR_PEP_ID=MMETSP0270-20121206/101359_1 /TAXON_ID=71861 /ORGANISM="Scrippsiella trochoidea, Strain CCMP3099" /LENGTH=141 /DNA_ID=CAMNT_0002782317 /DNA_START=64 /DNA_END=489 /DNA_ORIENTATION=+
MAAAVVPLAMQAGQFLFQNKKEIIDAASDISKMFNDQDYMAEVANLAVMPPLSTWEQVLGMEFVDWKRPLCWWSFEDGRRTEVTAHVRFQANGNFIQNLRIYTAARCSACQRRAPVTSRSGFTPKVLTTRAPKTGQLHASQ